MKEELESLRVENEGLNQEIDNFEESLLFHKEKITGITFAMNRRHRKVKDNNIRIAELQKGLTEVKREKTREHKHNQHINRMEKESRLFKAVAKQFLDSETFIQIAKESQDNK